MGGHRTLGNDARRDNLPDLVAKRFVGEVRPAHAQIDDVHITFMEEVVERMVDIDQWCSRLETRPRPQGGYTLHQRASRTSRTS